MPLSAAIPARQKPDATAINNEAKAGRKQKKDQM